MKQILSQMSREEKSNLFNRLGLSLHEELDEDGKETGYITWNDEAFNYPEGSFTTQEEAVDNALETVMGKFDNIKTYEDLSKLPIENQIEIFQALVLPLHEEPNKYCGGWTWSKKGKLSFGGREFETFEEGMEKGLKALLELGDIKELITAKFLKEKNQQTGEQK